MFLKFFLDGCETSSYNFGNSVGRGNRLELQQQIEPLDQKRGLVYEIRKNRILFLMLIPALVYFVLFFYLPFVGAYYAFIDYKYGLGLFGSPFVGFDNFRFLFTTGVIWKLTRNTFLYNLAFLAVSTAFQVTTAVLLSEMRGKIYKRLLQSFIFLPYFISFVLVGVFAYGILNFEFGMLNNFIRDIGAEPVHIYTTPGYWPYILTATHTWKWVGYGSVIYLAAIMSISDELYDVAAIDGANAFRQIWSITLPMLKPTVVILLLFNIGRILRGQFELFYQLVGRNGLLYDATDILDTYVYRALRESAEIELGTAAGLFQSIVGLIIIVTVNWVIRRLDPDNALF